MKQRHVGRQALALLLVVGCQPPSDDSDDTSEETFDAEYCAGVVKEVGSHHLVDGVDWHCADDPSEAFHSALSTSGRRPDWTCTGRCLKSILLRPVGSMANGTYIRAGKAIAEFLRNDSSVRATDEHGTLTYLRDKLASREEALEDTNRILRHENRERNAALKTRLAGPTNDRVHELIESEEALRDLQATLAAHNDEFTPLKQAYRQLLDQHVAYKSSESQLVNEIATVIEAAGADGVMSHEIRGLVVPLFRIHDEQRSEARNTSLAAKDVQMAAQRMSRNLHDEFDRILRRPMDSDTREALREKLVGYADAAGRIGELASQIDGYATRRMRWVSEAIDRTRQGMEQRALLLQMAEIASQTDEFFAENQRAWASVSFLQEVRALLDRYLAKPPISTAVNMRYMAEKYTAARDIVEMGRVCDNLPGSTKAWMETGCIALSYDRSSAEAHIATDALDKLALLVQVLPRRVSGQDQEIARLEGLIAEQRADQAVVLFDMILQLADASSAAQE